MEANKNNSHLDNKHYDLAVVIGRFQPLHTGHMTLLRAALSCADHLVVLVGSANEPRTVKNPFTAAERISMISKALDQDSRLHLVPIENSDYDLDDWLARANAAVAATWSAIRAAAPGIPSNPNPDIALVGYAKDESSFYLDLFPQWSFIDVPQHATLSATDIRMALFDAPSSSDSFVAAKSQAIGFLADQRASDRPILPACVVDWLEDFVLTPEYLDLVAEQNAIARYRRAWSSAPYAPIFVTADAMVVHEGRVLLVRRNGYPGRGLWALPGGFVEQGEPVLVSALRELKEETGIGMSVSQLQRHVCTQSVFDAPDRSSRGRTITHAFMLRLPDGPPPVAGSMADNIEVQAMRWCPLDQVQRSEMFEDHYKIIQVLRRQSA